MAWAPPPPAAAILPWGPQRAKSTGFSPVLEPVSGPGGGTQAPGTLPEPPERCPPHTRRAAGGHPTHPPCGRRPPHTPTMRPAAQTLRPQDSISSLVCLGQEGKTVRAAPQREAFTLGPSHSAPGRRVPGACVPPPGPEAEGPGESHARPHRWQPQAPQPVSKAQAGLLGLRTARHRVPNNRATEKPPAVS